MISVLFVDDEPHVGSGLLRMLRPMRDRWRMRFAPSGRAALEMLEEDPADVVVTDLRMSEMDGAQLLTEVERRFPQTIRIVLSGQCDRETALRCVGPTHLFYSKPCDSGLLIKGITRACRLRSVLTDQRVTEAVPALRCLPSPPTVYHELVSALDGETVSQKQLADLVSRDMGLAAKLLQLANSAFFGATRRVTTPAQAIQLLGSELLRSLVLTHGIASQLVGEADDARLQALWSHGMRAALAARYVASDLHLGRPGEDEAFTAGLLHHVGMLVLAMRLGAVDHEIAREAGVAGRARLSAERRRLGATHAEIGAYLLALWGLPDPIVESVAFHHTPGAVDQETASVATAVHAASALTADTDDDLDAAHLDQLGLMPRVDSWRNTLGAQLADGPA